MTIIKRQKMWLYLVQKTIYILSISSTLVTATQSVLRQDQDMREIFTCTGFSAFCRQFKRPDKGEVCEQL